MEPDFSNLDPDGEELAEAEQLYEDFANRQAEEQMLLEKEKETKQITPPPDGPWARFMKSMEQSHQATFELLNKLESTNIEKENDA